MSENFITVKNYLLDLDLKIVDENDSKELVVVEDEDAGIRNLVVTFQYRRRPWLQDPWHGDSPYFPC